MDLRNPDHIDAFMHKTRFLGPAAERLNRAAEDINANMTWSHSPEGHAFWNGIHKKLKLYSSLIGIRRSLSNNRYFNVADDEHHELEVAGDAREYLDGLNVTLHRLIRTYNAGVREELNMTLGTMFGVE